MLGTEVQAKKNPLRVAFDAPASSVCCEVKPDVVTGVTPRRLMHVAAAQPVRRRIQTWQHLHLLRLSSHLTEYEVLCHNSAKCY